MTEDQIAYAILFAWVGFQWGQWWSERKHNNPDDAGVKLLTRMFLGILEKRKMVGRAMTISTIERFECQGEKLSLTLEAKGDPSAYIDVTAVEK